MLLLEVALASSVHSLNHWQMPVHRAGTAVQGIMTSANARKGKDCESANQPLLEGISLEVK